MQTYRWLCVAALSIMQMGCLSTPGVYGGEGGDGDHHRGPDERYDSRPNGSVYRPGERQRVNSMERVSDDRKQESGMKNGWIQ
ncbi:hypothetical protein AB4Z48_38350 [Cupriavidus sp. 2TAF22]|uniref:hypothetical protein n=1 Tax=unclassified Cupriavidus TaxID=2640874 RepID=UPI003F8F7630